MYLPNLMPGDVHRLWMVHQDADQHPAGGEANGEGNSTPSMPSYTAISSGPLQPRSSTYRIRKLIDPASGGGGGGGFGSSSGGTASFSDEATTLDMLSLEMDQRLRLLKGLEKTGYNYLKPVGLDKTMRQCLEERRNEADNAATAPHPEPALSAVNIRLGVGEAGAEFDQAPDLDAGLEDRDHEENEEVSEEVAEEVAEEAAEDGIEEAVDLVEGTSSGMDDVEDEIEVASSGGGSAADDNSPDEAGQFFIAAEEYQTDHVQRAKRPDHSFLGNSSFSPPPAEHLPELSGGMTGATTGTSLSSAAFLGETARTTPLEIEEDEEDHDMTVE